MSLSTQRARGISLIGVVLLACAPIASADLPVLYDNFRADGGFQNTSGYFISAGGPFGAMFTTPATGSFNLDHVYLALSAASLGGTGPASARLTLRTNNPFNSEPSLILDTVQRDDIAQAPPTFADATYEFNSLLHPLLAPNTPYWVVLENAGDNLVKPFWFANDTGRHDPLVEFQNNAWVHYPPTAPTPTMRVVGNTVPEPSTFLIAAMASGALAFMRRTHKRT